MKLLEVCDPLFQYICRLKRISRSGHGVETDQIRAEIKKCFKEMRQNVSDTSDLFGQYEKVELALIFFVDFMIKESQLQLTAPWEDLAVECNELAGDEKFFDLLNESLAEHDEAADERLLVYHTCLSLGFTGVYMGQQEAIRSIMRRISARLSQYMDTDEKAYVCPEAYENIDSRNFIESPGINVTGMGIALVLLLIVWIIGYIFLVHWAGRKINIGTEKIVNSIKAEK